MSPNAAIYYTLNGSTPTTASIKYTGPIAISKNMVVKAIAQGPNASASNEIDASYSIMTQATLSFTPKPGTYPSPQQVSVVTSPATGVSVYYTTDGSTPTVKSTLLQPGNKISVLTKTTIKAVPVVAGFVPGPVVTGTYTIQ